MLPWFGAGTVLELPPDRGSTSIRRCGVTEPVVPPSMRNGIRLALVRLWQWLKSSSEERRTLKARAHFWAELREGECEADARSRS